MPIVSAAVSTDMVCSIMAQKSTERQSMSESIQTTPALPVTEIRRGSTFQQGFVDTLPLWLGVAPFGAIYAVNALAAGLDATQTLAMSLFVFAGASQFTAAGLIAAGVAPWTIVLTTAIINARHLLLSASLAPFVRGLPAPRKTLMALQLTDESFAIGMRRWLAGTGSAAYQFGSNISLYVIWQLSTVAGILLGSQIPEPAAYGLDLVFPLTFIGLLVPLLKTRVSGLVALLAAVLTIAGALLLPGRWYILLAGIVASGIGAVITRQGEGEKARRGEGEKGRQGR